MKSVIYIFVFLVSSLSFSQSKTLFEQGNTLYNNGDFAEAIDKYEAILKTNQHSAELYFNLANAHYKLNNIAPSIYYYEKAKQLAPNDKDIINNMVFAKNMTVDAIEVLPEIGLSKFLTKATNLFTFNTWAKIAIGFMVLFVSLLLVYYFSYSTTKKRLSFIGSLSALFLTCIALLFTFHNYNLVQQDNPAIIFAQESKVKSEPNLRSEEAFVLHEGTKIQILDTVNNWKKIKLADGKTGWISSNEIKALN
jgi:tetratricopeptide (TPR) repeat protein